MWKPSLLRGREAKLHVNFRCLKARRTRHYKSKAWYESFYMCVHVCMNPSSNIMHCQNIVYATHRKKKTWPWYITQFSLVRDCSSMAPLFDEHSLSTNIYFQLIIGIFGHYQPKQCIWDFSSNHGFIPIVTISIGHMQKSLSW